MKKKLLIAGGGYADIPLVLAAKELGYFVITSGNNPNDMAHKYADQTCLADFSDKTAMLALAKSLNIDVICPCANDFSAISCAYVAEEMGLPGHDSYSTSKQIHHKDTYREFALKHQIPSPHALGFDDLNGALENLGTLTYPVMIKPVDLTGGKGIMKVLNQFAAVDAIKAAFDISPSNRIVLEEFIEGTRHGFSAFIVDGKLVFHFADNEHYFLNQYMVAAASTPSIVSEQVINKLIFYSEKIVKLMSLKTGIFHVQFILRNNEPIIIEICRRPPGDLYLDFVKMATSLDYASYIVRAFSGLDCGALKQLDVNGFYTRHCVMPDGKGQVESITTDPEIEGNVIKEFSWWHQGDLVTQPLIHKLSIVFLQFSGQQEMLSKTENMPALIKVNLANS
jgi:biotin carboxylase